MTRQLTSEQKNAIENNGNTLILANPGTGKTFTIAQKYVSLVLSAVKPSDILCITFTNKARDRMEDEIVSLLKSMKIEFVHSDLNIHTFHSFAMRNLGETELIDENFLRLVIFRYLKEKRSLNYEDEYLINEIVPGLENHIRKLKSFGILPGQIDILRVKEKLPENVNMERDDLEAFALTFIDVFKQYEKQKGRRKDYSDLLINFLNIEKKPKFDYVLVDELQDMNNLEATIAIECSKQFFVVGDRKQSIFSFQGGSVSNFNKFSDSTRFILSRNHRSTNEILNYASENLLNMTGDSGYGEELEKLRNEDVQPSNSVKIVRVETEDPVESIGSILRLPEIEKSGEIAILSRKNENVRKICRELDKLRIKYSTSLISHSEIARKNVVDFITGLISDSEEGLTGCLMSPFFPGDLRKISALMEKKGSRVSYHDVEEEFPGFSNLRKKCSSMQALQSIMEDYVIPASVSIGQDYFRTSVSINSTIIDALSNLKDLTPSLLIEYLRVSSFKDTEIGKARVTVSSVHRAKGLEFNTVIYFPSPDRKKQTIKFYEAVAEAILLSLNFDIRKEIEDEVSRIDFVAFTRAKNSLLVVPRRKDYDLYENDHSEAINADPIETMRLSDFEGYSRAYTLFLSGDETEARNLIGRKSRWLIDAIQRHFNSLSKLSYSGLMDDRPFDYLKSYILKIRPSSRAMTMGSNVHMIAQKIANGEPDDAAPEDKPYAENISSIIKTLQRTFPEIEGAEKWMEVSLDKLLGLDPQITFRGAADLILKNGRKYLIIDWKTSKSENYSTDYMVQLEAYRQLFSKSVRVPAETIEAAIGYVALRKPVNTGKSPEFKITFQKNPEKQLEKLKNKVGEIMEWKRSPQKFIEALKQLPDESHLYEEVMAELERESSITIKTGVTLADY